MLALHRAGRRADALEVYRSGRLRTVAEQGREPGPDLVALHAALLRSDPALEPPRQRAVRKSAPAEQLVPVPAQLPPSVAGFTGRDAELARLDRILAEPVGQGSARPSPG